MRSCSLRASLGHIVSWQGFPASRALSNPHAHTRAVGGEVRMVEVQSSLSMLPEEPSVHSLSSMSMEVLEPSTVRHVGFRRDYVDVCVEHAELDESRCTLAPI